MSDLEDLREVARVHREHERYHSMLKLEQAAALRRDSNALKVLSDRVGRAENSTAPRVTAPAAGCADLTDLAAVATTGVLFMEGEDAPAELTAMRRRLDDTAGEYARLSSWLGHKMDGAWKRLHLLLTPELADTAHARFQALGRTTAAADAYGLAARYLGAAVKTLDNQDLAPAGVRADPVAAATMLRTASWLIDTAAATVAEAAARLSLSDPDWTQFIAEISERITD
ncbi:MAG TPA: hypothetical protein VE172_00945 [Stackebrandtia sp.]|jgi:hypothetical protein|uniref:hypothetical protein n=1 Tax=Stackebrandtia sp. TaxID=2023065 RepID=UPI002D5856A6|nr:hypothetical protein [Stackebrandtia sp.]HZE37357.1 hypothetical protein [Stackebrandtia sp.]